MKTNENPKLNGFKLIFRISLLGIVLTILVGFFLVIFHNPHLGHLIWNIGGIVFSISLLLSLIVSHELNKKESS